MKLELIAKHEKDSRACRDAFALTLKDMMAADKSVCYVDCDLMGCVNTKQLMAAYPDRAYEAGIAEANAAGVCAGLAATGKKVYLHTFGTFASRRIYDQIYMSAAYADLPVHVFGSDAGVCAAFNGGTHMPLEDAAMYLSIPKAVVTDPCDYAQLKAVTEQVADCDCVTYTRFVRKDIIRVYGDDTEFTLGKGVVLHESSHDAATIITSGIMVDEALKAYEALDAEGIAVRVVDMFTWKPLDEELVLRCAAETGAIVTAENHNVVCGLGSAVANCLAKNHPTVQEFVGVQDMFGQVDPQSFQPDIESDSCQPTLYPVLCLGLYDRALLQRLRGYDVDILGEYYQSLDLGVRSWLFGYKMFTTRNLAVRFPNRVSVIEDRSECSGMDRFYTKALSIKRVSGKNMVSKWKPYVDKKVLSEEVKKKQVNLQKTDFFTLIEKWGE